MPVRAAILFTAYAWDPFVQRQFGRMRARAPGLEVHLSLDAFEDGPPCEPPDKCLTVTRQIVARLLDVSVDAGGLVEQGSWGRPRTLWWNLDFHLYAFFDAHPEIEYCLAVDFDAWVSVDVAALLAQVAARRIEFVGFPHEDVTRWSWAAPHLPTYPADLLQAAMLPIVVISRGAARHLRRRRTEMARDRRAGRLPFWPFCEAFVATELASLGFRTASLAEFGDTTRLRWRPVITEREIVVAQASGFVHPVRPG